MDYAEVDEDENLIEIEWSQYGYLPIMRGDKVVFLFIDGQYVEPQYDEFIDAGELCVRKDKTFYCLSRPDFIFEEVSPAHTGWAEDPEWENKMLNELYGDN